jgi:hypothetical protein
MKSLFLVLGISIKKVTKRRLFYKSSSTNPALPLLLYHSCSKNPAPQLWLYNSDSTNPALQIQLYIQE